MAGNISDLSFGDVHIRIYVSLTKQYKFTSPSLTVHGMLIIPQWLSPMRVSNCFKGAVPRF
jgi:hypothetical protein